MVKFASPSDLASMLKGGEVIASHYIQPHLGGDIAFIHGVIKALKESSKLDKTFIDKYCDGQQEFFNQIDRIDWDSIVDSSGVPRQQIQQIADIYSQSKTTIFCWSMGLTHHLHGVANIQSLVALALSRGMIGKPGSGLLPLRGHSNIQGTGSVGFTPKLKAEIEKRLNHQLAIQLPTEKGLDTMACMHAAHQSKMDVALMLGGNLLAANPDTHFAIDALNKINFKCFISSTINLSHVNGVDGEVLVLPIKVRDEETQSTTQESMFNFVRLSDGGINRFPQLISETQLICSVGEKLIDKNMFDFKQLKNHTSARSLIANVIPGFSRIKDINESKEEFHIEGRILHTPTFNTPNKKAKFIFHPLPSRVQDTFYLSTIRSEGQFNSIIYHEQDTYRGQTSRDVLLMNPEDMKKNNFKEDQKVDIVSVAGRLKMLKVKPFNVRSGNILTYYPEANVLIPNDVDSISKTPAFKSVPVKIEISTH